MSISQVFYHSWTIDSPKANIVIVHGLGEHILRYEEIAQHFNSQGYGVYGFDHIGHGQTEGKRGHLASYDLAYDVIDQLLEKLDAEVPKVIYGHSFGGNLGLSYVLDRKPSIAGIISSAPFITAGSPISPVLVWIGKIMSEIYPSLQLDNGLDLTSLSTSPAIIDAYTSDPLVHSKISARLAALMLKYAERLQTFKGSFPVPLLLMHGAKDKITGPDGTHAFAKQITSAVDLYLVEEDYHEIHNGTQKREVWNKASDWIHSLI